MCPGGWVPAGVGCIAPLELPQKLPRHPDPGRAASATSLLQLRPASTVLKTLDTRHLTVYPTRWQTPVRAPDDTAAHRLHKHYTGAFFTYKEADILAEPTAAEQAAARAKEQAEQDALPYKWQQTIGDVDVTITGIPGNFKSRDLVVEIKKQSVKAGVKGQEPVISVCSTPLPLGTIDGSGTQVADQKR